jgi:hypothetical protein
VPYATMLRLHHAYGKPWQLTGYSDVPSLSAE